MGDVPSDEKLDYSPFETNRYDSIYTPKDLNNNIVKGVSVDNSNINYSSSNFNKEENTR